MYAYVYFVFVHDDEHGLVPYSVWDTEESAEITCFQLNVSGLSASVVKMPVETAKTNGNNIH
jgi:hypothetical protein